MTTVRNTLKNPAGGPLVGEHVAISLVTAGFVTGSSYEVLTSSVITTDATGLWTVNLTPNADITPAGTYYVVRQPGGDVLTINVPASGTHWVHTLLVAAPASPDAAIGAVRYTTQALTDTQKRAARLNIADNEDRMKTARGALAKTGTATYSAAYLGDSNIEGSGAGFGDSLPLALGRALRALAPRDTRVGGRGYVPIYNVGATGWPWTVVAGAYNITLGGAKHQVWIASTGSDRATYVPSTAATSVVIQGAKFAGGGTGYYKLNGGGAVTFSTDNGGALAYDQVLATVALTPGVNSVEVGWSSGGAVIYGGGREYAGDTTAGAQVHNLGYSGGYVQFHNASSPEAMWASIATLTPNVVLLQFGVNDANTAGANRTPAQFRSDIEAMLVLARAALAPDPLFVIVLPHDCSGDVTFADDWADYVAAVRALELADTGVKVVDLGEYMPASDAADTFGFYVVDGIHYTAAGAAFAANIIARTLAG